MPQKPYKPHYEHLKNKWTDKQKELQKSLWEKHKDTLEWFSNYAKHAVVGSVGGFMLLTTPFTNNLSVNNVVTNQVAQEIDKRFFLISDLSHSLPDTVQPLSPFQEETAAQTLSRTFGFRVAPYLEHKRLNTSYGYIGQEQHLARYPGDTLYNHFDTDEDESLYASYGMAPGLGAWGYFSPSKQAFTQKDNLRERYYIAVQTFLSPGYYNHVKEYSNFFKFRKMLVVNPENGKAIVADIADSGPSEWTGKQLGGSPEVMHYLERVDGAQKGPVLYFFIDDPRDKIPLGPIEPK